MKVANRIIKSAMLSTISIASFGFGTLAYAQDSTAAPQDAATDDTASEDIIVTATKREQTLQDVPVAVSVTSADAIEKAQVRDLIDLQTLAPTLRVTQLQSSANTNFIIRGFGNGANNPGIEPSVGVFIDGVYRSRSAAQIGDLPNLKRIEVLRGPQSTLFGKNASAGVISIVTAAPQFKFGGSAEASYGNYNAIIAKADITGPISDTIAFSLAGNYNRRDGYARDLFLNQDVNDRNRWGARAQLLFQPSEDTTIRLIGDYDKIDENCCVAANVRNGPTGAIVQALSGGKGIDANNPFSYNVYNNFLSTNKIKNYGFSGQLDQKLGNLDLTSITAYRVVGADTNQDSDFTGADLIGRNSANTDIKTFTQELRLTSNFDGPLNFLLGGYYFDEKIKQKNDILFGTQFRPYGDALVQAASGGALNVALLEGTLGALEGNPAKYTNQFFAAGQGLNEKYGLHDKAYSFFGSVDFEITDGLTLTGGLNYTKDKKRFNTDVTSTDVFSSVNLDAPAYAPFRQTLLYQGGLAQAVGAALGLGRSATAAEIGAFAGGNQAAFGQINAGVTAFAAANANNPAANPLNGLKGFQFLPQFLNLPNAVESGRTSDDKFTYSARLAYKATDSINLYASYGTGFKSTSVNLSRDSRPLATDSAALIAAALTRPNQSYGTRFAGPENATVYEVGIKGKWDQVAFNLTFFQQSIKGFQSNVFTGTGFQLANAGKQTTKGIEFDGTVSPIKGLTFSAAMVYLDPKYNSFKQSAYGDISGTTPGAIPKLSTTLGAAYTFPVGGGDTNISLRTDYHYESQVRYFDGAQPDLINFTRQVDDLAASATLELGNGLQMTVWGRNLTNAKYITTYFPSVAQSGSISGYPSQPRTYGVAAKFKF
jgi:iron complex outermembrane recepter protein